MKALFELFRRFDARRIFGFIRRLGGMSRPKIKCYDLRSTRALRVEGDTSRAPQTTNTGQNFYPRPPGGGRQGSQGRLGRRAEFLSTPSGWRATSWTRATSHCSNNFYPRPPGGGRPTIKGAFSGHILFLSTPSGWRATSNSSSQPSGVSDFYPRPPGGGRLSQLANQVFKCDISIHALRVEGDQRDGNAHGIHIISIHALRVEGDPTIANAGRTPIISIHALREEGDFSPSSCIAKTPRFLSTPSGWRATHVEDRAG